MGADINMYLINTDGKYITKKPLWDGRSHEWFDNLKGGCGNYEREYDELGYYIEMGIPDFAPAQYAEKYNISGFYDFRYIRLKDFLNWVDNYKPQLKGGYVTRHEQFLYERKGLAPLECYHYKDKSCDRTIFMEWTDEYEPSYVLARDLVEIIKNYSIEERDKMYIVYCFDC